MGGRKAGAMEGRKPPTQQPPPPTQHNNPPARNTHPIYSTASVSNTIPDTERPPSPIHIPSSQQPPFPTPSPIPSGLRLRHTTHLLNSIPLQEGTLRELIKIPTRPPPVARPPPASVSNTTSHLLNSLRLQHHN